jgi:glucokinase
LVQHGSPNMSAHSTSQTVFAVDLGGTHLRAGLVERSGAILDQVKHDTPQGVKPECIVDALTSAAESMNVRTRSDVVAGSIMVPGTIDKQRTIVVQSPNLACLDNFGLKRALEETLQLPVLLENDANAAAVGEMWMGAARGARNVICVTLGTGVGGGIILDGKLWRGTDGSAGEIGHSTVEPFGGPKCKCGNTGCLEMFASATAIVRMAREALVSFPDSVLDGENLTAKKIYEAGRTGDKVAIEIFQRAGRYLGAGLANLINILGPEVIVIGGGVADGWDLFETEMREQIRHRAFPSSQHVKIKKAECGDNAGLLGAARLAFDSLMSD